MVYKYEFIFRKVTVLIRFMFLILLTCRILSAFVYWGTVTSDFFSSRELQKSIYDRIASSKKSGNCLLGHSYLLTLRCVCRKLHLGTAPLRLAKQGAEMHERYRTNWPYVCVCVCDCVSF